MRHKSKVILVSLSALFLFFLGGERARAQSKEQAQIEPKTRQPRFATGSGPSRKPGAEEAKVQELLQGEYKVVAIAVDLQNKNYKGRKWQRIKENSEAVVVIRARGEDHIINGEYALKALTAKGYFHQLAGTDMIVATTNYDKFMNGVTVEQTPPETQPEEPQAAGAAPISVSDACAEFRGVLGLAELCQNNFSKNLEGLTGKSRLTAQEAYNLECCKKHLEILHRCEALAREGKRAADEGWKPDPNYIRDMVAGRPPEKTGPSGDSSVTKTPGGTGSSQRQDDGTLSVSDMYDGLEKR